MKCHIGKELCHRSNINPSFFYGIKTEQGILAPACVPMPLTVLVHSFVRQWTRMPKASPKSTRATEY